MWLDKLSLKRIMYIWAKKFVLEILAVFYTNQPLKKWWQNLNLTVVPHVFIKDLAISHFKILNTAMSLQIYSGTELT